MDQVAAQASTFQLFAAIAQFVSIFLIILSLITFVIGIYFAITAIKYMKTKTKVDQEILQSFNNLNKIIEKQNKE